MRKALWMAALTALAVGAANAEIHNFRVNLSGDQEVGGGDPDGYGVAHLFIDDSVDPHKIDWLIEVYDILVPIAADHIHQGDRGANGPVRVDFAGQLEGNGLADTELDDVLANPTGWYVNVHNSDFPGGAIRGQIPEPSAFVLLALAGVAALRRR